MDTTPLALVMVRQGLGLGIGHVPVCAPQAHALQLSVCPVLPGVAGPGSYYIEYAPDQPQRASVQRLAQALRSAAQGGAGVSRG